MKARVRERSSGFMPAFGLRNAHVQTIWPSLLRRPPRLQLERLALPRPDGEGVVDLVSLPLRPGAPGVLLLHGLEGSARSPYVRGLLAAVEAAGWNGAVLEFRSCGPSVLQSAVLYHSGKTDEIDAAVKHLQDRWPDVPLAACGFSLGGNALLKWMAERAESCPLVAAVAVSVPFDLAACAARLDGETFFSRLYRKHFLRSLKLKAVHVATRFPTPFTAEAVRACRTFREFDELVTAPLFGFASAEDYWARNSSAAYLSRVTVPTCLVSAKDDPFIPPTVIPMDAIEANPHLELHLYARGGHAGFLSGWPWRLRYHVEPTTLAFLDARFQASFAT